MVKFVGKTLVYIVLSFAYGYVILSQATPTSVGAGRTLVMFLFVVLAIMSAVPTALEVRLNRDKLMDGLCWPSLVTAFATTAVYFAA